jgi:hypothetical protein
MQRRGRDDGHGGDAAQRRGYRFLTSWLPDSFILGVRAARHRKSGAGLHSTRDACATRRQKTRLFGDDTLCPEWQASGGVNHG